MKKSKPYKIIFLISILVVICFPFGAMPLFMKETVTQYRVYNFTFPMKFQDVFTGNFQDFFPNFGDWLEQHAAKRQSTVCFWSKLLYHINTSSNPKDVVIGKDGMLFLRCGVIDRRGIYPSFVCPRRALLARKRLRAVQAISDYCKSHNAKFVFAIAPNKVSIYPERLPSWYTETGRFGQRGFLVDEYIHGKYDFNFVDLTGVLLSKKHEYGEDLFFRSDPHWSTLGGYIGYKAILANVPGNYRIAQLHGYRVIPAIGGALARMLGIFRDEIKDFATRVDYENSMHAHGRYLTSEHIWQSYRQFKNDMALNDAKMLMLRDSYATNMIDYFNSTFRETRIIHYDKVLLNATSKPSLATILNNYQPNIVVLEMVERAFSKLDKMDYNIFGHKEGLQN